MIEIPSPSREEKAVADMLEDWLLREGLPVRRLGNNLWAESCPASCGKPTVLLNAHIDTVKPASSWSSDPYTPAIVQAADAVCKENFGQVRIPTGSRNIAYDSMVGKSSEKVEKEIYDNEIVSADVLVYGLGANDDGGSVVAVIEAYKILASREQPYRLVLSLTAEEEVSGKNGIELILPFVCGEYSVESACSELVSKNPCDLVNQRIALAIVGEPTGMQMAVAEKGLMVLDCMVHGKSGHAARNEGVNAIYNALPVMKWFAEHEFEKVSEYLGPVKMSVTQVQAGTQHNVIPDLCSFVVDVRANDCYTNVELFSEIQRGIKNVVMSEPVGKENEHNVFPGQDCCKPDSFELAQYVTDGLEIKARSTRLGSSHIDVAHPVVQRGLSLGLSCFGSPTLSNQALLHCPSLKIGPGDSARSHTAGEFISLSEIEQAVDIYVKLLDALRL